MINMTNEKYRDKGLALNNPYRLMVYTHILYKFLLYHLMQNHKYDNTYFTASLKLKLFEIFLFHSIFHLEMQ